MVASGKDFLPGLFDPVKLERGKEYWREGLVSGVIYGDGVWQGTVSGILGEYRVRIMMRKGRLESECSCPDRSGLCKHAAAVIWGWYSEPEKFFDLTTLFARLVSLTKEEALNLLYRVATEEGELLSRLLGLKGWGEKRRRISGRGIIRLVKNLDFSPDRPWFSWRAWEERVTSVTDLLRHELRQNTEGAWEGLLLLTEKMADLVTAVSEQERLCIPLLLNLLDLLAAESARITTGLMRKLIAIYLSRPFERNEEERFVNFFGSLGKSAKEEVLSLINFRSEREVSGLALHRKIWLAAELILSSGRSEEADDFTSWCLGRLDRLLFFLDFLTAKGRYDLAKTLLRSGLSHFKTDEDRFLLRGRLAAVHRLLGEKRQALYLEVLNFEERPAQEEYYSLKKLALEAGEWKTVKGRLLHCLQKKSPRLYEVITGLGE